MQVDQLKTATGELCVGPLLITPQVFADERGFFLESWNHRDWAVLLAEHGQSAVRFVQDNHSRSSHGVLRGLHYQLPPHPQGKLIRCIRGDIFDVVVDLRLGSVTFGQSLSVTLSATNHRQLWVPVGFAHGFLTLSFEAEVLYKATDFWSRDCERALYWNDPDLAIPWPLAGLETGGPLLSPKDAAAPLLADLTPGDFLV